MCCYNSLGMTERVEDSGLDVSNGNQLNELTLN